MRVSESVDAPHATIRLPIRELDFSNWACIYTTLDSKGRSHKPDAPF